MPTMNDLKQVRLDKLDSLIKSGVEPYPTTVERDHRIGQAKVKLGKMVKITGRIMAIRGHGKIYFIDIQDESGKLQGVFKSDAIKPSSYARLEFIDIGDFLAVQGTVQKTQAGELSVFVEDFQIISKSLRPMPDQWYGFKDVEERYRKRYLDMILNPSVKQVLDARFTMERAIRTFLWGQDYIEVETPILQSLYGGTNAKPFTTHMNALDSEFYLRVAPELYLKRLIVGGYERVFEIARNFRNEGIDLSHQPEFTMMEFYEAYADYHRIMDLTEDLIKYAAQAVNNDYNLTVQDRVIDISGKWRRITVDEALVEYAGIHWDTITDEDVTKKLKENSITVNGEYSKAKGLFALYDHLVTSQLIEPTWVIDYPREVSPLSHSHRSKPGRVERFEGYVGGKEICDGWSEIISGIEQRERFDTEQRNMRAGDVEAQPLDEEFIEALEYGCPPLGGIGIGIDRLCMLLTNTWTIREVIAFPTLRPIINDSDNAKEVKSVSMPKYFSIDSKLKQAFPSISVGIALIKDVHIEKINPLLEKEKLELVKSLEGMTTEQINTFPALLSYRKAYKAMGIDWHSRRPSPEALLRRVATGKGLYTVNTCVDAYNLVVMKYHISAGAFDADTVVFPTSLQFPKQADEILLLGDKEPTVYSEKEFAYYDQKGGFNIDFNYRDAQRTMVTEDTKNLWINVDGIFDVTPQMVQKSLNEVVAIIQKFCGGTVEFSGVVTE